MEITALTTDVLKTPAGQVVAVGLITGALRYIPMISEKMNMAISVVLGIALSEYYTAYLLPGGDYIVAALNGLAVSLAAIQGTRAARTTIRGIRHLRVSVAPPPPPAEPPSA